MDECQYRRLYNYVETKTYPKDLNKSGKHVLRRSSKNYVVEEGKLYYVDKTADKKATFRRLVIQGREEVERVLSECHLTAGGHRGRDSTIEKIRSRYYWPNMLFRFSICIHRNREMHPTAGFANAIAICNGDKPEELTFRTA